MEVILKQDVAKIGTAGNVVKVKDGYARNYLIPNGLAVPLTSGNLKQLEEERSKRTEQTEKLRKESLKLKERLGSLSLTIPALTQDDEKLYGSIHAQEISQALKDEGLDIDKTSIMMIEPIKALGIYEVPIRLYPDVEAKVKVWVVKK